MTETQAKLKFQIYVLIEGKWFANGGTMIMPTFYTRKEAMDYAKWQWCKGEQIKVRSYN